MPHTAFSLLVCAVALISGTAAAQTPKPRAWVQTSMGDILLELDSDRAPASVANFVQYATAGHFDGTVIYRVQPGFVLQAGSYEASGSKRPTRDPIPLEAGNGLSNVRGSVAMARDDAPNSATAEFFINLADNARLDRQAGDAEGRTGYAVFGQVVYGMDVVDRIAMVPLGDSGPFPGASPITPITITRVVMADPAPPAAPATPATPSP
jgi:cyclophilin family peptidyl-prolyl cis-trans isomerase